MSSENGVWRIAESVGEQTKVKIVVLAAEISKIEDGAASGTDEKGLYLAPRPRVASANR